MLVDSYSYSIFPALNPDLYLQKQQPEPHLRVDALKQEPRGNSPMTRRTKQEVKSAQRIAQQQQANPELWAK